MIRFTHKGNFSKVNRYFEQLKKTVKPKDLDKYGKRGVEALASSTPIDTGLTSKSWNYEIRTSKGISSITFYNSNVKNGVPIAIILQYGHGTNNGGWVQGRDYINPAIQPIFDEITKDAWREVTML